jgi:anti-sigma B factor antagonist
MSASPTFDGNDFGVVCDSCGHEVANLATSMHSWDFAWSLLHRHGWRGASLATGPHTCPRCRRAPMSWLAIDESAQVWPPSDGSAWGDLRRFGVAAGDHAASAVGVPRGRNIAGGQRPSRDLVLDCGHARLIDGAALAALVRIQRRVAQRGGRVVLVAVPDLTRRMLQRLCLASLFVMVSSERSGGGKPRRGSVAPHR